MHLHSLYNMAERERERERVWVASTCQTCSKYVKIASAKRRATREHGISVYYKKRFVASSSTMYEACSETIETHVF